MFKLFGKKKEKETPEAVQTQSKYPGAAELAAKFAPTEFEITAVTGPLPFTIPEKADDQDFGTATLPLTAWREDDGEIHQESALLITLADNTLLGYLRRTAPGDSIIQVKVRQAVDGTPLFLLVGMPVLVMEPELKAILNEQVKPSSTWVEGLGTFTLNRTMNWFQAEVDWLGQPVQATYNQGTDEEMRQAQQVGLALMANAEHWNDRVRTFAVQQLLKQTNQWTQEYAEEENMDPVDQDQFAQVMELEAITFFPNQSFEFWFNGGDLFWGRSFRVTGTLTEGPTEAHGE